MTTTSIPSGDLVSMEITSNGSTIPDTVQVHSIQVRQEINRVASATLEILDGDASEEGFAVSSSDTFVPGASIEINLGYDGNNTQVFAGVVTKQSLSVNPNTGPLLLVECRDQAIKMTVGRKNTAYQTKTDSDLITSLIQNNGLSADVSSTSNQLPEIVQYYASDWDFMLSRAQVNSMVVTTLSNKVSVFSPTSDTSSVLTVTYGDDMFDADLEMNAVTQLSEVKSSAWDHKSQSVISQTASNSVSGPGNISSSKLADVVGLSDFELQTTAALSDDDLTQWAKGQMLLSELSKITGTIRFYGNATVAIGKYLTIAGMGDRFNGDHFISTIEHDYSDGNWTTTAGVGMSSNWFVQEAEVMAPSAAGLLPGIEGLYNATVKQIDQDPDNAYRILVTLPLFNDQSDGVWARLTNFYSSSGFGAFFLPEIGDEVIVGFLNQDPRFPVILGSMYSEDRKPYSELTPNADNTTKAIVTKSELRIVFDDENKVLTITTPNNNVMVFSDQDEEITITDQNSNKITMSSSGIDIKSPSTINIEADEEVNIKGQTGVNIQASGGDVSIKGMNISSEADVEYSAKGSATASLQASGELTIKGAMVMIN